MEFLRRLQVVASLLEEIGGSMEDFHWKYHRSSSRCFIGGYGSSLFIRSTRLAEPKDSSQAIDSGTGGFRLAEC